MTMPSKICLCVALVVAGAGCARVQSKAAYQDGNKFYKEENYKRAIEKYSRAVELDPEMAEAYFYLGSSHQALYRPGKDTPENKQHLDDAVAAFKKTIELNKVGTENLRKVRQNALGALTGIYTEDPYRSFDDAHHYASELVKDDPNNSKNLYAMANLFEKFGKVAEAEETYRKVTELNPQDTKACGALAGFYNKLYWDDKGALWQEGSDRPRRARFQDAVSTLEHCASLDANDPGNWQKVSAFYWDKAYRDPLLDDKSKEAYANKGMEAVDKALAIKPDYFEAVIYKGLLFRVKAAVTQNPTLRQQYLNEAQDLQKHGLELKKQQEQQAAAGGK